MSIAKTKKLWYNIIKEEETERMVNSNGNLIPSLELRDERKDGPMKRWFRVLASQKPVTVLDTRSVGRSANSKKERITKDVRYQQWAEMTLGCVLLKRAIKGHFYFCYVFLWRCEGRIIARSVRSKVCFERRFFALIFKNIKQKPLSVWFFVKKQGIWEGILKNLLKFRVNNGIINWFFIR